MYNFYLETNYITPLQSGFIAGDSTTNQLTYLYNVFCEALDKNKEVRIVFFYISKAFDRVWHKGLMAKLKSSGMSDQLINLLTDYLNDRRQCVIIPGSKSEWAPIRAGVPQGSIIGPLMFLIYINDIVSTVNSNIRLFADDTGLYLVIDNNQDILTSADTLNSDIRNILQWSNQWLVTFNPTKTESLLISRKRLQQPHPSLIMQDQVITQFPFHKHLGVYLSSNCTWHHHIDYIKEKAWLRLNIMRKLKFRLDRKSLEIVYFSFIRPLLEYADTVWDNCTSEEKMDLDKIQNEAARIVTGTTKLVSLHNLHNESAWESLGSRRRKHKLILFYKMINRQTPQYLSNLVPPTVGSNNNYSLRNNDNLFFHTPRTTLYANSFLPSVVREWNNLPITVRNTTSLNSFKFLITGNRPKVPKYYYTGNRLCQVLHTRLRTDCSTLNQHLFQKNIVESPLCECGEIENTSHYLFKCHIFANQREVMFMSISSLCTISLTTLLYGHPDLTDTTNKDIFHAVQHYIITSKRFKE